ncbi:MAG: ABC transporter ATP-binding protein [Desulfotignum sp.]|jgi:lipopolysaccharide transport system ATP-binding protein|nr:ABC transporter ATP-binding protein [Desulfotignum sp.]
MNQDPVIQVQHVSKAYKRYARKYGRMAEWLGLGQYHDPVWVLTDICFDVARGQSVGITGVNGAGKSTLLKIITGTTRPSSGEVHASGAVSALLELGMGFHPEFTGRQNCHMAGQLQGFRAKEIEDLIPEIADFAEIQDYFDQPVRTYSSGMQVRLAFALATARRPAILIVDEALSVGDTYFQHKSFDRIRRFRKQGTTLLFVSHDRSAIQSLCDRALLLDKGSVIRDGNPEEVTDFYNALIAEKENTRMAVTELDNGKKQIVSGTGQATVKQITLYNSKGEPAEYVGVGEEIELRIRVKVCDNIDNLVLGYGIKDRLGQFMYGTNTWYTKQIIAQPHKDAEYEFRIFFPVHLGVGNYSIVTALTDRETHLSINYEWRDLALVFHVVNVDKKPFVGCLWIDPVIRVFCKK